MSPMVHASAMGETETMELRATVEDESLQGDSVEEEYPDDEAWIIPCDDSEKSQTTEKEPIPQEDGSAGSKEEGSVDLPTPASLHGEVQPASAKDSRHVIVETASTLPEDDTVEQILRNQSPTHTVRMALTYLLVLLIPACLLTWIALPAFRLLLGTVWIIIFALFASLVWFIQTDVIRKRALHPYIHAAYDAVVLEIHDFVADWRQHVLRLTHEAEEDLATNQATDGSDATETRSSRPKRKIRSRIFKIAVKPFLPLVHRRKRRNKPHTKDKADEVNSTDYIPAPDGSASVIV